MARRVPDQKTARNELIGQFMAIIRSTQKVPDNEYKMVIKMMMADLGYRVWSVEHGPYLEPIPSPTGMARDASSRTLNNASFWKFFAEPNTAIAVQVLDELWDIIRMVKIQMAVQQDKRIGHLAGDIPSDAELTERVSRAMDEHRLYPALVLDSKTGITLIEKPHYDTGRNKLVRQDRMTDDTELSRGIFLHAWCGGTIAFPRISRNWQTIYCKDCGLHLPIAGSIRTVVGLKVNYAVS